MADSAGDAADLLQGAYAEGELSEGSAQALLKVGDLSREVGLTLGSGAHQDELLLVTILVDDSGSVGAIPGGPEAVGRGHDMCLEALEVEGAEVLVHTRYLNSGTLSPYRPLSTAARLGSGRVAFLGSATPLYRESVITLGTVIAKVREQKNQGRQVRAFTLLITDGGDNASRDITAESVRFIVTDMLEFSADHIVAGMGIGADAFFLNVFREMGIPDGWILTTNASAERIQELFDRIAKSLRLAAGGGESGWLQLEAGPVSDG